MPELVAGTSSDPINPVLDLRTQIDGLSADLAKLEYQVFDCTAATPVQVFPVSAGTRQLVDLDADRLALGHFVARWTQAGANRGRHEVRWYLYRTDPGVAQRFVEPFDVVDVESTAPEGYALVSQLRADGVGTTMATSARLATLIDLCSRQVEQLTGLWFEPRALDLTLDGPGAPTLFLDVPICSIASAAVDGAELPLSSVGVYARHLSQRLLRPDDRRAPQLVRKSSADGRCRGPDWYEGVQNVALGGVFGWTESAGDTLTCGRTPVAINLAVRMLVVRELELLASADRVAARRLHEIRSEQTRDQSVTYADRSSSSLGRLMPAFGTTGDPEIDAILSTFRPPIKLGIV